jgi:THO complex subunit 1
VFCGRVFIFLFQSFPLGDRSSVNLRGEFHVENTTTFDDTPQKALETVDEMDLDTNGRSHDQESTNETPNEKAAASGDQTEDAKRLSKTVTFDTEKSSVEPLLDINSLYPIFWSLQHDFSEPTRLFKPENFEAFKRGLDSTIARFKAVHEELESRGTLRTPEENKRGIKRKRGDGEDDLAAGFNPKYLTSRDLFELEVSFLTLLVVFKSIFDLCRPLTYQIPSPISQPFLGTPFRDRSLMPIVQISELAFRRHILVQALILIDFLLSLTPKAKEKLSDLVPQNRAVLYSHTLSPEDVSDFSLGLPPLPSTRQCGGLVWPNSKPFVSTCPLTHLQTHH